MAMRIVMWFMCGFAVSLDGVPGRFTSSEALVLSNRLFAIALALVIRVRTPHASIGPSAPAPSAVLLLFTVDVMQYWQEPDQRSAPPYKYSMSAMSNVMSSWFQYEALKYVSFPLQVLSKSSKVLSCLCVWCVCSDSHLYRRW